MLNSGRFVSSSAIPLDFTAEDFEQVKDGNVVVKVVYLRNRTVLSEKSRDIYLLTRSQDGAMFWRQPNNGRSK